MDESDADGAMLLDDPIYDSEGVGRPGDWLGDVGVRTGALGFAKPCLGQTRRFGSIASQPCRLVYVFLGILRFELGRTYSAG